MGYYRKKPVIVEAIQFLGRNGNPIEVQMFIGDGTWKWLVHSGDTDPALYIKTLEGDMMVKPMDWIIKGVNGEFYPFKPDIFEKTCTNQHETHNRLHHQGQARQPEVHRIDPASKGRGVQAQAAVRDTVQSQAWSSPQRRRLSTSGILLRHRKVQAHLLSYTERRAHQVRVEVKAMWFFFFCVGCGLLASGLWLWNVRELRRNDRGLWREAMGSCWWLMGIGPFGLYAVIKVMRL